MTEAERLAANAFPEDKVRRDRCLFALQSYGRLVQEAAAKECRPHNDDDAMDKQAKAECAKAIREMPLP